jgi:hypothetical protein
LNQSFRISNMGVSPDAYPTHDAAKRAQQIPAIAPAAFSHLSLG